MTRAESRRSEAGFSLIEMIIVVIIIAILVIACWMAFSNAKVAARNESMKAAAASPSEKISSPLA